MQWHLRLQPPPPSRRWPAPNSADGSSASSRPPSHPHLFVVSCQRPTVTKLVMVVVLLSCKVHQLDIFCYSEKSDFLQRSAWGTACKVKVSGLIKFPNESKLLYCNLNFQWWLWSICNKKFPSFHAKTWAQENSPASIASMRLIFAHLKWQKLSAAEYLTALQS